MSAVVGEIVIDVTADIGPLIRQTSRAEGALGKLETATGQLGRGLGRVGAFTTDLGKKMSVVSAGIAAVALGALALTRNAASMGDAIGDASKAAGLSTTAFQEYRFALKEAADMSDEDFAASMTRLTRTLGDAAGGSKSAIAAFEAIGISQAQIASGTVNTETALAAFIAKMEATEDPAVAAAMATDLFGKSGAKLGASLSGVPGQVQSLVDRARELGVVMGPEAIKAASDFDQKMNELGAQFEAVKMKIANVLLPVLVNQLIPFIQTSVIPTIGYAIDKIGDWIDAFNNLPDGVQTAVLAITTAFAAGGPVLLAIGAVATAISAIFSGPAAPLILLGAAVVAATQIWPEFGAAAEDAFATLGGSVVGAIELIGKLIKVVGAAEQALVDMFTVSQQDMQGMDFSGASGLGFGKGSTGGMGDMPGGGINSGSSNSFSTGAAIADGLVDGVTSRMAERQPEVDAVMQSVTDRARALFGVQSPSTVFAEIGGFIGQGLANGISTTQGIVSSAVSAMGSGAVAANNAMVTDIMGGLNTLLAGSQKAGAALALVNTMIGASQEIKKGTFGFASAARVVAQGMAFVKAIKGAKSGGGGAVAGAGGASAMQAQPTTTMQFTFQNDPFGFGESFARQMVAQLNKAQQSGSRIIGVIG